MARTEIAFVDTVAQAVVATVPVPKPHTIAIRADGKVAYVASQEQGKFALVVVDLDVRSAARTLPLEKTPRDLEFGHDGKALYFTMAGVNAIAVLDPVSDKIVAQIPTGASPHIAGFFRGVSAGTAVVQGPGELQLFDPSTNTALRAIAVGKQPHWMAATSDGKWIYVHQRGLERRHRRRSGLGQDVDDRRRQRAAQGRDPAGRGRRGRGPRHEGIDRQLRLRAQRNRGRSRRDRHLDQR
jgi:DNA-binding beta-propeller fold protein YncE